MVIRQYLKNIQKKVFAFILFEISSAKRIFRKILEGEIFIRSLLTTLLQTFCEIILNFQVIVRSFKDPSRQQFQA